MKALIKESIVGKQRLKKMAVADEARHLLEWTKEDYCWFHYEQWMAFFENQFKDYPTIMHQIMNDERMKGYWKMEEMKRTERYFLPFARDVKNGGLFIDLAGALCRFVPYTKEQLEDEYMWIHSAKFLKNEADFMNGFEDVLALVIKDKGNEI